MAHFQLISHTSDIPFVQNPKTRSMVAGLDTELKLQGDSGAMRLSVAYLFANIPRTHVRQSPCPL